MEFSRADDTFFESEDACRPGLYARTAAKMVARQRQDVIAGELSRLAAEEYLEDVLKHMQTMEVRDEPRPPLSMHPPHPR